MGAVLIQVGQHEAAADVLEMILTSNPANLDYWVRLLVAHHRAGHVRRARLMVNDYPDNAAVKVLRDRVLGMIYAA